MIEVYDVVLIPLIIGLVELLKYFGIPKQFIPIASLTLGITLGIIYVYPDDLKAGILVGLMIGLSASGMYSSGKAMIEKESNE